MTLPTAALFLLVAQASATESTTTAIRLPQPEKLQMSLGDALAARQSTRAFATDRAVTRQQLATLLWAMTGVNRPDPADLKGGKRTAPSAFGACAVDVVVTSHEGTFRYDAAKHELVPHGERAKEDLRKRLTAADWAQTAPLLVVLVAHYDRYPDRVTAKAGQEYARADAGVISQNLYLACAAMGLGTVVTASAPDDADATLGVGETADVIFVLPVGTPAEK